MAARLQRPPEERERRRLESDDHFGRGRGLTRAENVAGESNGGCRRRDQQVREPSHDAMERTRTSTRFAWGWSPASKGGVMWLCCTVRGNVAHRCEGRVKGVCSRIRPADRAFASLDRATPNVLRDQ